VWYTTRIAIFTFGPGNMSPKGHEKRRFSIQTAEKVPVLAKVGRKQQRYAKLHSFLEDTVVSRSYQILGSAALAQNGQEVEKQRET
jgi:hypothetical protein